ncbi:MAG: type I toxin-antitoxin system SymE family toxin [Lachnospiraceae bacterium]|nr:type I toxin-antitoxin system SymE family toxin [Lachnospiraceae bacterium]
MAKKNVRELKVCAQSGYRYKDAPSIRLMGQWLEAAGFHIGDPVLVTCEDGQLIITPDTARAELIEAEKAFMEKETKKLHDRFLKEKKTLHAQFVAERQAEYANDPERGEA